MIEKNREEQAAEARVSKMLAEALAEDLGDIPKVSITVEELKALERADRRKRRKRKLRYFSMTAAAVLICVVALYALWPETAVPVSADKNTEHRVEEKDGMVVINEGDVEGGSGLTEITETDWDKVEKQQNQIPELGRPGYVPNGYEFEHLHIEKYQKEDILAEYFYSNGKEELRIVQRIQSTTETKTGIIEGDIERLSTKKGDIYAVQEDGQWVATKYLNNGYIKIVGKLEKKQTVDILKKYVMP
ncbi:MAG: hypothetical protein HFE75_04165 [Firmicutes bacterium]|nr:hypothetical protein [Bacillota bacterium]